MQDLPPPIVKLKQQHFLFFHTATRFGFYQHVCPVRACRRYRFCANPLGLLHAPPCFSRVEEPDRSHIWAVLRAIDGIHEGTLRPPARDDADLIWAHEQAIAIFRDALRMMPEFTEAFEAWHRAYTAPPPKPLDPRLAKLELDRMQHNLAIWETLSRTATGRAHLKEAGGSWVQGAT
ncbi:hypothetical protein [Rhizobium sp. LjRoot254]|uniref:hypothetical protein n=1 Tax=Rhizobium sp. LjRoot254 TaxID=3342297 RepID=UPI003ECC7C1F